MDWEGYRSPAETNRVVVHATFNDTIYFGHGNTAAQGRLQQPQPAGWDDRFHIVEVYRSADGTANMTVDDLPLGPSVKMSSPLNIAQTYPLWLGAYRGNYYMHKGDMAELRVYNRELSRAERQSIREVLKAEYGITPPPLPRLWLKAAAQSVETHGASQVSLWRDQSGNELHVSQNNVTNQPTWVASALNGHPALLFDGNDALVSSEVLGSALFGSNQATIYAVLRQDGRNGMNTLLTWQKPDYRNRVVVHLTFANDFYFDYGSTINGGRLRGTQPTTWDDQFHVVEAWRGTNGAASITVDGTVALAGAMSNALNITLKSPLWIGSYGSSFGHRGEIAELRVYDRALNTAERQGIREALKAEYDIVPLPSPQLWLHADGAFVDRDAAGRVSGWRDLSGTGLHVGQGNPTNQPIWVASATNGRPAVRFDGNDFLMRSNVTGGVLFGTNQATIYAVLRQDGSQPQNTLLSWEGAEYHKNRVVLHTTFTDDLYFDYGNTEAKGRLKGPQPLNWDDRFHVLEAFRGTDGSATVTTDGVLLSTNMSSVLNISRTYSFWLGSYRTAGYPLKGEIAELQIFNRALSASERALVTSYLKNKYALRAAKELDWLEEVFSEQEDAAVAVSRPALAEIAVDYTAEGEVELRFAGAPGTRLTVETSDDLVVWTVLQEVEIGVTGSARVRDAAPQEQPVRFYRLVWTR